VFFGSCSKDGFKEDCIESREILQNAKEKLKISHVEKVSEKGKIESTVVQFDNTKAKDYLKSKGNELSSRYESIKRYIDESGEGDDDVLFMLAFINEMTYWLSGEVIEEHCKYLRLIENREKPSLSNWMLDEVFAPFINNENTIEEWLSMDSPKKYKDVYDFLMVSERVDKRC
jgi:hypothetical protein